MITQDIKYNINKIDFDLKNLFENVSIEEKSKGNKFYFEISANSKFFNINERKEFLDVDVKVFINKIDIVNSNNIKWSYLTNPLNESSDIIDRVSKIDDISMDIYEIVTGMKMCKEYFNSLVPNIELINESNSIHTDVENTILSKFSKIINSFGIKINNVDTEITTPNIMNENNLYTIDKQNINYKFYHDDNIKISDKFILESKLNSIDGVNWTLFKDGFILINYV